MYKLRVMLSCALLLWVGTAAAQIPPRVSTTLRATPAALSAARLQALRNAIAVTPASRPSRKLFLDMIVAANGDKAALRTALENANVVLKPQRLCHVSGAHPGKAFCVPVAEVISDLQVAPTDRAIFNLAMNDLWESLGGSPGGGDINTCGGRGDLSVTNVQAGPGSGGGALGSMTRGIATGSRKGSASAQTLSGSAASSKVSACRSAQRAGLGGSMGTRFVPGSPGYRQAVANAQGFLTGFGAACRDGSSSGLVAAAPGGGTQQMGAGDALAWVAGATADLADAMKTAGEVMSGCESKAGCALSIISAAVGAVADANDLVGNESEAAEAIGAADTVLTVVGGAVEMVAADAAGGAAIVAADVVLPAIAVGVMAYTVYEPVGEAIADVADPLYVAAADYINGVNDPQPAPATGGTKSTTPPAKPPAAGGGATMPSEEGRSCSAMAAKAARFNDYCSQPGNDWQSYDCMSFVARLNGCADPGLIRPAPGEDYQCSAPRTEQAKAQLECEQRGKLRDLLARRTSGSTSVSGSCSAAGLDFSSFMQQQRAQLCMRVSVEDQGGICSSLRNAQPASRSNTR